MKVTKVISVFVIALVLAFAMTWSADAQINATAGSSIGTLFGATVASTTIVPSVQGSGATGNIVTVKIVVVQTVLGVSCGGGTNTATPTLAWTGPDGVSKTLALSALSISAMTRSSCEWVRTKG